MNIVYMHTHDSGRYLQPYGYNIPTPNLMRLARESTLFRHCYCAGPTCSPSRSAQLTGAYPHENGMIGLAHRGFALNDYNMHMARYLASQGFETALCGVQHEAARDEDIGYTHVLRDIYADLGETPDARTRDLHTAVLAADYIKQHAESARPFFLSVGLINTHRPFPEETGDIRPDYVMPPPVMYDSPETRGDMAGYMRSAATADMCVGTVWDAIRAAGLQEKTAFVFTTDHGIAFPYMKCNLYDTGIGVALMIRYPGNPMAGKASDALVSHVDIVPTLCGLGAVQPPPWARGSSLLPLMAGEEERVHREIFAEVTYHAAYEPMRCVRTRRFKLIRRYDDHLGIVPANIDEGPSKTFLMSAGLMQRPVCREMLFDLYLDPMERENRVDDPAYREIYADLAGRLTTWMQETGDPLPGSAPRVPKPAQAQVNKLTCADPEVDDFE